MEAGKEAVELSIAALQSEVDNLNKTLAALEPQVQASLIGSARAPPRTGAAGAGVAQHAPPVREVGADPLHPDPGWLSSE
jgi:hypothetical protein